MRNQNIFHRYELKYLISMEQQERLKAEMSKYMVGDEYGKSTICNIYYDTPDYLLIRRSLERPVYKEKLRVRSYGIAKANGAVFVELKKKYRGVVYKRRIEMTEFQSVEFLQKRIACVDSQIAKEINYALDFYKTLQPTVHLSYKREAFFGKTDDFRITFDTEILFRTYDLSLQKGIYGTPILPDGKCLLELKTADSLPLWLTAFLTKEGIYKTSFSKYGTAYTTILNTQKGGILYA